MVVKYDVVIQPIRLISSIIKRGGIYVVAYERKSSAEFVSQPQPASKDGEVAFGRVTDPITVPSFTLNFETPRDKKLVSFSVYDFTRRPKVEKLVDFEVALGEQCNAFANESFCSVRDFPFRDGKVSGTLRVMLRMYPVGTECPSASVQQPAAVLKGDALALLQREKLIPSSIGQLEGDSDILEELVAKLMVLERGSTAQRTMSQQTQDLVARRTELQGLLALLQAADNEDGGRSQLDSADRHMLELLEGEEKLWMQLAQDLEAQSSRDDGASGTTIGGGGVVLTSPLTAPFDRAQARKLMQDLQQQRKALKGKLQSLEAQQATRDVTQEAIEALGSLQHLDALIAETEKAHREAANENSAVSTKRGVKFKDDADQNHDEGPSALAEQLARAALDAEATEYAVRLLDSLRHKPYDGAMRALEEHRALPVPRTIAAFSRNTRIPAAAGAPSAAAVPALSSTATIDDIFAVGAAVQTRNSGSALPSRPPPPPLAPSNPRTETRGVLDDLFGSTATGITTSSSALQSQQRPPPSQQPNYSGLSTPPVIANGSAAAVPVVVPAATKTQPVTSGVGPESSPQRTPSVAPPPPPKFEVLPIPTTSTPTPFVQMTALRAKAHAVRFVDPTGTKFLRGCEVTFSNSGNVPVVLNDFQVKQEDIFSSTETVVPSRSNTSMLRVDGGDSATIYLSFGPQMSLSNALMGVLYAKITLEDGRQITDRVRLAL